MNARQLIENEEDDTKDEVFDVPVCVTTKQLDTTYFLKRETKRQQAEGFSIGREWFRWTWNVFSATVFSRKEASDVIKKIQQGWRPAKAYNFEIIPAKPV